MGKTGLLGLLLVAAACASGGGAGSASESPGIKHVLYGDTDIGSYAPEGSPETSYTIASPALTTWQYLPIAYSRLGLTVTKYDSTTHVIEGERLRSHADFGGKSLSSMLNCGDVAGVPNVDHYDVTIRVRTSLSGSSTSSTIGNTANAFVKPSAVSGDAIPCTGATGIADRVAAAVTSAITEGTK